MFAEVENVFCPTKWSENTGVTDGVGVFVCVWVGVEVFVGLTVGVFVCVRVGVAVFVGVLVTVGVALAVNAGVIGIISPSIQPLVSSIFITIFDSS